VIEFSTKDGREITSTKGFAKYMMASLGITDFDTSVVDDDPGATGVSFVYQDLGFTWMWDDYDPSQMITQMIYYTFGGCFGGKVSPLANHCIDYHQMWE
jgi:hypothetical protein